MIAMTEDDKAPTSEEEYYGGEQQLLGAIVLELASGKLDALANFLARGKPVSAAAASFLGTALQEDEIGGCAPRRLVRITHPWRPKTDSAKRIDAAARLAHWEVNKPSGGRRNPKREEACVAAAKRFGVDLKLVRLRLKIVEREGRPPFDPAELRKAFIDVIFDVALSYARNSASRLKSDAGQK